ncbi:MAG: hypothetical protein ACRC0L_08890 [Angustibacter sp.]
MVSIMVSWSEPRYRVTYVPTNDEPEWDMEGAWIAPVVGDGVISEAGNRYRIVDVWTNFEKHGGGVGEYGVYAYIEPASGDADRPGRLHGYYRA